MMGNKKTGQWTRRRLLHTIPAALAPVLISGGLRAAGKTAAPFSRFADVAHAAGLTATMVYGEPDSFTYIFESMASGCAFIDYDNDGWMDIFILCGRRLKDTPPNASNRLYKNNRDGTFSDVTAIAGLLDTGWAQGVCVGDYNNDGFEDLFLTYYGQNRLYRNNGDGTFADVSRESGVSGFRGSYGLTVVSIDADEDGWPDIFVVCDSTPSLLLMNNRDGTFREEALFRGVALSGDGRQMGGMGAAAGDYNLDGHTDLLKTHYYNQATGLYRNDGKGYFDDVTIRAGLNGETRFLCFGAGFADFDNDGYPDILLSTGTVYPEVDRVLPAFPARTPRILFRNQGDGTFVELGPEAGAGISARHCSRGAAFGDFDNDGDIDVLIMNVNEPPTLLRNDAPPGNHWIKIRLEGTKSNRSAIGARVLVRYSGKVQAQELLSQSSFLSSNDPRLHFGLGAATTVDVEIHWPSGLVETMKSVAANQLLTLKEGSGQVQGRAFR